jgi:S1-C subfamily serine protease
VFALVNSTYLASGFFISSQGLGVSVNHFYEASRANWSETKLLYKGKEYSVKLVASDPWSDLILVQAQDLKSTSFLRLTAGLPQLGSRVYTFGFSINRELLYEQGFVLELNYLKLKTSMSSGIRSSVSARGGYSGAPLLDSSGDVVGINKCISNLFPDIVDSVAIPATELLYLLRQHNYTADSEGVRQS